MVWPTAAAVPRRAPSSSRAPPIATSSRSRAKLQSATGWTCLTATMCGSLRGIPPRGGGPRPPPRPPPARPPPPPPRAVGVPPPPPATPEDNPPQPADGLGRPVARGEDRVADPERAAPARVV